MGVKIVQLVNTGKERAKVSLVMTWAVVTATLSLQYSYAMFSFCFFDLIMFYSSCNYRILLGEFHINLAVM